MADALDDYRSDRASSTGGLVFDDPREGDMLRRSLQYLIQRVSGQLMTGNFSRVSMPVHLNEPRSLLERITDDWAYAAYFLPKAAAVDDPVERIKLVAAFVVSGLHCIHTLGKPFNPILGSTYRTTLSDGTPCFVEQTSHHPPVTHYLIQPESSAYLLAGFSGIDGRVAWGLDTGLSSRRNGITIIQFADGSRIAYNLPRMLVRGLAAERKCEFLGPFSVFYEDHGLVFDFLIDPPQPYRWSLFRPRVPSDYIDGVLYKITTSEIEQGSVAFSGAFRNRENAFFGDPDIAKQTAAIEECTAVELRSSEEVSASVSSAIRARNSSNQEPSLFDREIISYARGTFLGYLDVDGKRYWDIRETPKEPPSPHHIDTVLRSDCRFREDVVTLRKALDAENDVATREMLIEKAQGLKEELENIQRMDRKLRREGHLRPSIDSSSTNSTHAVTETLPETALPFVEGGKEKHDENSSTESAREEPEFFPASLNNG